MIYIDLLLSFFKIGLFSFGGAYGAILLIRDVVIANGWADEEMFANLVALSETTPGPIMVNIATYVGSGQAGFLGALCATIGVVLPAFFIILLIMMLFQNILKRNGVQAVLEGIKPCFIGVILSTGVSMAISICIISDLFQVDLISCAIFLLLAGAVIFYRIWKKKEFPPVALILLAAVCGGIFYA